MGNKKQLKQPKIGVLGGGQLGRMLALDSARLGIQLHFLDKSSDFPAGQVCQSNHFVIGDFTDYDSVINFGNDKDIVTIEIENVNTEALKVLEAKGVKVYPSSNLINTIKDKGIQKKFYTQHAIPTAEYFLAEDKASIISAINEKNWDYPFVQKARTEGYDGKGVQVIKAPENLDQLWDRPSVIEVAVQIDKELAIIIARSSHGSIAVYDPVEMVFDGEANVLDYQKSPASITETQKQTLEKIARNLADKLDLVGVLAVEFFLTVSGDIRVNEAAPRTHNSGHHTIEACRCSQFEQQIRAISGLPLGDTQLISPSSMLNVLGEVDAHGIAHYEGLEDVLNIPEAKVHLYGKQSVKPKRKMGHINILSDNVSLVNKIKSLLKVKAYEQS